MALPVLIIGSGLGGLTLAHALEKQGIPYKIFERDSADSQRAQGYRISIDGGGASGLMAAVSPELFDAYTKSCGESHPAGGRIDGPSGKLEQAGLLGLLGAAAWGVLWAMGSWSLSKRWSRWTWVGSRDWLWSWVGSGASRPVMLPKAPADDYKTDRRVLRDLLVASRAPHVTYDAEFTSYTLTRGSVIAHFADGTTASGCLLVGADGTRSKVAAQLIGAPAAPRDLGLRVIYGKTVLTESVDAALHAVLRRGPSFVVDRTGRRRLTLVAETMRFDHSLDAPLPEDYMFWALSGSMEAFETADAELLAAQGEAAAAIASRLTRRWDASVRVIFEHQAVDQTAALRLTSSDPDGAPVWPTERRVTLLGDAIHCMPPTGGQGANAALQDAATLAEILGRTKGELEEGWRTEAIREYEDAMRYNIGDIVGIACIAASYLLE